MTHEEMIYRAIRGEDLKELPFVPRLDLWYQGNKLQNTLPDKYKNASLVEILDDLGLGYHCVVPDFSTVESLEDYADVGLGIHRTQSVFYTVEFDVERKVEQDGPKINTVYHTPYGDLTTQIHYDEQMRLSGITQPLVTKFAIQEEEDYQKLAYIFDRGGVKPRYEYYDRLKEKIGDRGPVVGFQYEGGSPMHALLKEMTPFETFWYNTVDCPELMEGACESIRKLLREILMVMADSPCEILYVGANYDSMTTNPRFFRDFITEELKWSSQYLHSKGKLLLTHTDGDNTGLLDEYVKAEVDVADSICPAPMTKQSLGEIREAFSGKIAIWGGIAAISVLEDSMTDYEFEKYLDKTLEEAGDGRRLILSIADSTPPAAKFDRLLTIMKKVKEFGAVK